MDPCGLNVTKQPEKIAADYTPGTRTSRLTMLLVPCSGDIICGFDIAENQFVGKGDTARNIIVVPLQLLRSVGIRRSVVIE